MSPWIWLAVVALLLVAEMLTVHLVFASLALAAFAAAIANALGLSLVTQGAMFAVFAIVSLVFLRPTALRHLNKQEMNEATNVDALIGATAVTTSVINQSGGQVKLSGEIWSAHTLGQDIDTNEKVIVVAIDGASARVKKVEEE